MNFGQAVASCFRQYVQFRGHASRPEYWWFALFSILGSIATAIVDLSLDTDFVNTLWGLALFLPGLAVAVRRLRDGGYAWPWLFVAFIPIAGAIVLLVLLCQPTQRRHVAPTSSYGAVRYTH